MYLGYYYVGGRTMLCRVLITRMESLPKNISALYQLAGDKSLPETVRLAAAGSLASFLSTTSQPLERWLLDTLTIRMGLCLILNALGRVDEELAEDVRLMKRQMSPQALRRIETTLGRLTSCEFAGGGMVAVISDPAILNRLYDQAMAKAAYAPHNAACEESILFGRVESLLQ